MGMLTHMQVIALQIAVFFFLSGAAGLIYEIVLSRELVHIFGAGLPATSTVVCVFMAGLGLGALLGARLVSRTNNLLTSYATIEFGIAGLGVLIPILFGMHIVYPLASLIPAADVPGGILST